MAWILRSPKIWLKKHLFMLSPADDLIFEGVCSIRRYFLTRRYSPANIGHHPLHLRRCIHSTAHYHFRCFLYRRLVLFALHIYFTQLKFLRRMPYWPAAFAETRINTSAKSNRTNCARIRRPVSTPNASIWSFQGFMLSR